MRSAAVLAAVAVAGALAVLLAAARDERDVAWAVGLPAIGPAPTLERGNELCRRAIEVPVAFERVRVVTITQGLPGPPLALTVTSSRGETASGRVAPGYRGGTVEARVGHFPAGERVSVCVRNLGARGVVLLGLPPGVLLGDLGDTDVQVEPAVVFARDRPVATLAQVPEMLRRAALFKPVEPWMLWVLLAAVALGLPALLIAALRATAARADPPAPPPATPPPRPRERAGARRD